MNRMLVGFLALVMPTIAAAQQAPVRLSRFHAGAFTVQDTFVAPAPWRPVRVAKWVTLAGAASGGIYGFVQNSRADRRYRELETMCQADPIRCADRTASGAYADPDFESRYQTVRTLDRRSHRALVASQVGVAASVVLFLIDLPNMRGPTDKPYTPPRLQAGPDAHGGLTLRLRLPASIGSY